MSEEAILKLENVKKYFELKQGILSFRQPSLYVKAVDNVSFSIDKGKIFGLVGESGCGKTTIGRCISRLETITDGKIEFMGRDISGLQKKELKQFRSNMQMIFQDPYESLNPRLTVFQSVADPLTVHESGQSQGERKDAVFKALMDAGMKTPEEMIDRYPHELSGGQRQRVAIARALVVNPKFIIADEPVSMLDVSIRAGVMNLMLDLKEKYKISYVFVTHDVAIARYMSDDLGVMYLGDMVETSETDDVIMNPVHPYTRALLAAVPIPDPDYEWEDVPIAGDIPSPINLPKGCRFHPRCMYAMDICKEKIPERLEVSDGHFVNCFFAEELYASPVKTPKELGLGSLSPEYMEGELEEGEILPGQDGE